MSRVSQMNFPKKLYFTQHKGQHITQCKFCKLKQKINPSSSIKCYKHALNEEETSHNSNTSQQPYNIILDTIDLLKQIEENIDDYILDVHENRLINQNQIDKELQPIKQIMTRISNKIDNIDSINSYSMYKKYDINQKDYQRARNQTRSQKYITSNFDQLFQDTTVNDQIKQWVIYFQKILINREIREEIIPYDEQVDMKIFKQSMEKKFLSFSKNSEKAEQKLTMALQKLLYYMDKTDGNVQQMTLKKDINFIENSHINRTMKGSDQQNITMLLFTQSLALEQYIK